MPYGAHMDDVTQPRGHGPRADRLRPYGAESHLDNHRARGQNIVGSSSEVNTPITELYLRNVAREHLRAKD